MMAAGLLGVRVANIPGGLMLNHAIGQAPAVPPPTVPVMSPQLPTAARLLPYLRRIDAARIYTNFGPLVLELEARLTTQLSLPTGGLVTASSGTAALVGAVLAAAGRATADRPFALMPAYTFVATAVAAEQCGYKPYLADIDPTTWLLDPERLLEHPELHRIGVVIPVAAYGKGVPQAKWLEFREKTGIPVVIDGAASFESLESDPGTHLGSIPVVVSFHATKSFACGEGGAVACSDRDFIVETATALNFGFNNSRSSISASINGKLSEYHAAVGLAELDGWLGKSKAFAGVAALYRRHFEPQGFIEGLVLSPEICSSYALFQCKDVVHSTRVQDSLRSDGVGFRLWYGAGVHAQPHFSSCTRTALNVTDRLAPVVLGLPMSADISEVTVARVIASIARVTTETSCVQRIR